MIYHAITYRLNRVRDSLVAGGKIGAVIGAAGALLTLSHPLSAVNISVGMSVLAGSLEIFFDGSIPRNVIGPPCEPLSLVFLGTNVYSALGGLSAHFFLRVMNFSFPISLLMQLSVGIIGSSALTAVTYGYNFFKYPIYNKFHSYIAGESEKKHPVESGIIHSSSIKL